MSSRSLSHSAIAHSPARLQITPLSKGPNVAHWNTCLAPYLSKDTTWGALPWYVGETYVYHRLLEASGYWDQGSEGYGLDIFAKEKAEALELSMPQVSRSARRIMLAALHSNGSNMRGESSFLMYACRLDMLTPGRPTKCRTSLLTPSVRFRSRHVPIFAWRQAASGMALQHEP